MAFARQVIELSWHQDSHMRPSFQDIQARESTARERASRPHRLSSFRRSQSSRRLRHLGYCLAHRVANAHEVARCAERDCLFRLRQGTLESLIKELPVTAFSEAKSGRFQRNPSHNNVSSSRSVHTSGHSAAQRQGSAGHGGHHGADPAGGCGCVIS